MSWDELPANRVSLVLCGTPGLDFIENLGSDTNKHDFVTMKGVNMKKLLYNKMADNDKKVLKKWARKL